MGTDPNFPNFAQFGGLRIFFRNESQNLGGNWKGIGESKVVARREATASDGRTNAGWRRAPVGCESVVVGAVGEFEETYMP